MSFEDEIKRLHGRFDSLDDKLDPILHKGEVSKWTPLWSLLFISIVFYAGFRFGGLF